MVFQNHHSRDPNEQALRQKANIRLCCSIWPYGYRLDVLEYYVNIPQSPYEQLEGLEQLRMLENGIEIKAVFDVDAGMAQGVDSPEDVARIETLLKQSNAKQIVSNRTGTHRHPTAAETE